MNNGPDGAAANAGADNANDWREREQRQRSVRFMMMFLLMLLLMDGEEENGRTQFLRRHKPQLVGLMNQTTYDRRRSLDRRIHITARSHPRYRNLVSRNRGIDYDAAVREWATDRMQLFHEEFSSLLVNRHAEKNSQQPKPDDNETTERHRPATENDASVLHYPWNVTGLYHGDWVRSAVGSVPSVETQNRSHRQSEPRTIRPEQVGQDVLASIGRRSDDEVFGIYLLPPDTYMLFPNTTDHPNGHVHAKKQQKQQSKDRHQQTAQLPKSPSVTTHPESQTARSDTKRLPLTKTSGKIVFQLSSRPIPGMKEISLVEGYIKIYDSAQHGYSSSHDILLPATGIFIRSIGRLSLVANAQSNRSVLAVAGSSLSSPPLPSISPEQGTEQRLDSQDDTDHRRLLEAEIAKLLHGTPIVERSDHSIEKYPWSITQFISNTLFGPSGMQSFQLESPNNFDDDAVDGSHQYHRQHQRRRLSDTDQVPDKYTDETNNDNNINLGEKSDSRNQDIPAAAIIDNPCMPITSASDIVLPFPYVPDDPNMSIRRDGVPEKIPAREQQLEANAGACEFEIRMDVQEEEWSLSSWRNLMFSYVKDVFNFDPAVRKKLMEEAKERTTKKRNTRAARQNQRSAPRVMKPRKDQALAMALNGTIQSLNCDFEASVNLTAVRTDWSRTAGKATSYSFYMMLTCLAQIVILLRQLLHTQSQSLATRVSLLSIGWHTVIDAMFCLVHTYWSLALTPAFTAFASVAFFKLLIFSVLEMKYMAMIIQARNARNGGATRARLQRQVAMLHLRFYVALLGALILFFSVTGISRTVFTLVLYSFWVPQIVHNAITEARRPLHHYFIFGMSFTRLIGPAYLLTVPDSFLKEIYPDSVQSVITVQLLVLWVSIQTALLAGQARYGPRFMIPARFLPPKFDYNRPIPQSMLPPGALDDIPSEALQNERGPRPIPVQFNSSAAATTVAASSSSAAAIGSTNSGTTRNRIKGRRASRADQGMVEETVPNSGGSSRISLECIICCNDIDIRNRNGYMLAPCNHIFHKDCLMKWMEVKMECPVCRKDLPTL